MESGEHARLPAKYRARTCRARHLSYVFTYRAHEPREVGFGMRSTSYHNLVGRSETLDPVDITGHRHDVCCVPDDLQRDGAIQDELLTATVHDWCQLAM